MDVSLRAWSLLCLLVQFSTSVAAQERERPPFESFDVWSDPNPGVRYLRRVTTAPCTIHVLQIDLDHEGVSVDVTPRDERWRTVDQHARGHHAAVAINGGFWETFADPSGLHVSAGEAWEETEDNNVFGFFGVDTRGRARISPPEEIADPSRFSAGTSGRPMLVRDGELDLPSIDPVATSNLRQPRTAVGVSRSGRTLWLLVTDGRQEHSVGLTMYELARVFVDLGVHRAMNLDGGGSSTLYVQRLGGVANVPSGSRWEEQLGFGVRRERGEVRRTRRTKSGREMVYVRGVEREVMNAIVVRAPDISAALAPLRTPIEAPLALPEVVSLPPTRSPLPIATVREWARPVGLGVGALLFLLIARKFIRRFQS